MRGFEDGVRVHTSILARCDEIRKRIAEEGLEISDEEYKGILAYSNRKRKLNGKSSAYLVLLIEDEIRDKILRDGINTISLLMMAGA